MDQRGSHPPPSDGMPSGNIQQQGMQHAQQRIPQIMATIPGGGAPGNSTVSNLPQQTQQGQQHAPMTAPMMMNLMTNPALAAAAASSSIFPPAAMLSNPSAFLAMPEAYGLSGMNSAQHLGAQAAPTENGAAHTGISTQNNNNNNNGMVTHLASSLPMPAAGNSTSQDNNLSTGVNSTLPNGSSRGLPPLAPYGLPNAGAAASMTIAMPNLQTVAASAAAASGSSDKEKRARSNRADLTAEEKAKQNRDRNREHARSTRLRKKAYVQKLKELVECLHAERTEEVRQRRVAVQHLAEKQNVRRSVVRNFLRFHTGYETDARKWVTLLEDDFWLKQPVTPYRSFRRSEIEQEYRISKGVEGMVCDAASLSVMIEGMGSRSQRWMQIKREEFAMLESQHRGSKKMPRCIQKQDSRLQHAVSSLSSSSGSSNHFSSSGEDSGKGAGKPAATRASARTASNNIDSNAQGNAAKVSASSGSSNESRKKQLTSPKEYHDYHAQPLPDPKLNDSEQEESPEESNNSSDNTKRVSTDSSSGDDSAGAVASPAAKKRKASPDSGHSSGSDGLPANIAKKGGIGHSIRPESFQTATAVSENGQSRLSTAPAVSLPPFAGIGKKRSSTMRQQPVVASAVVNNRNQGVMPGSNLSYGNSRLGDHHQPAVISADAAETSSSSGDSKIPQIRAQYHLNEDDMILMEDILMCPFVFRSHNAVLCGALAECVMPGMLRAHFSARNKLQSVELVYDAMGFMQQLERASGSEGTAQIIPGSLEMALTPSMTDALVITLAKPPYLIVNVNEIWTRTTGYTQMEVEGKEYQSLLEGEGTVAAANDRPGKPRYKFEEVAKGRCACSTNIHYDKQGRDFIEFVCSYPLTNAADEVTHLLHMSKELPSPHEASTSRGVENSS